MACPVQFICRAFRNVGLVLLYYVFSIGITFYNNWLMKVSDSVHKALLGFPATRLLPYTGQVCFYFRSFMKIIKATFLLWLSRGHVLRRIVSQEPPLGSRSPCLLCFFLSGLPLSPLHDVSSPHPQLLPISPDASGHAVLDRETPHHSELDSLPP